VDNCTLLKLHATSLDPAPLLAFVSAVVDPTGSTTPRRKLLDMPHTGEKISADGRFFFPPFTKRREQVTAECHIELHRQGKSPWCKQTGPQLSSGKFRRNRTWLKRNLLITDFYCTTQNDAREHRTADDLRGGIVQRQTKGPTPPLSIVAARRLLHKDRRAICMLTTLFREHDSLRK